jgi:hypothetical protein
MSSFAHPFCIVFERDSLDAFDLERVDAFFMGWGWFLPYYNNKWRFALASKMSNGLRFVKS